MQIVIINRPHCRSRHAFHTHARKPILKLQSLELASSRSSCRGRVAVAEPAIVVLVLGLVFRKPVAELVARLRHGKLGSIETAFHDLPKELPPAPEPLQLPAGRNPDVPVELTATSSTEPASAEDLVREAPIGAVIASWVHLEEAIYRSAGRLQLSSGERLEPTKSIPSLVKRLHNVGAIDSETLGAILKVREIRNRVVHFVGEPATTEQAVDYREVIDELVKRVTVGTENARVKILLVELHADAVTKVTVGPLAAIGVSASEDAAREVARSRLGKWGAKSPGVKMMVTQDDAALLLRYGAVYEPGTL